jgi:hypothetical protein
VRGKQSFAAWDHAQVSDRLVAQGFDPIRHVYFQPLVLGRAYVALRIFGALGRAGEIAVPEARRQMAEAPTIVRWFNGAYALLAIARRHRKLRGEIERAVGPARLPADLRDNEGAVACAKVLQQMADAIWAEADADDAARTANIRRLAEALAQGVEGEASMDVRGDELSLARLASSDRHFLRFDQDVAWHAMAVALCAEVQPEELYFPAASTHLAPAFTPEAAKEYALIVPPPPEPVRAAPTPGRNDPCSCGSGRKYKRCCGTN